MFGELVSWYARESRPLPWREPSASAWSILVCEVMSQQTPVVRVLPAWTSWMERWPTPRDLAVASPSEVIIAWGKLGYPRRALRLQECARVVANDHDNELPRSRDALLALPGIGPYTADAVIAFAYHQRSVVLDTNTRRVIARLHGAEAQPPNLRKDEIARADALVPLDPSDAWQWNAALMEFGALVCTARTPRCEICPIIDRCAWFAAGCPEGLVERRVQPFKGTHREARGKVMAVLRSADAPVSRASLSRESGLPDSRFAPALESLLADKLVVLSDSGFSLPLT